MRHILLHHHLFKNAGTTFDEALKKSFGEAFSEFHPSADHGGRVYPQELFTYLKKNPSLKVLSSHHFFGRDFNTVLENSLLFEVKREFIFHDCIFIRHPVMRLVSMYVYLRTIPKTEDALSITAHECSLHDFFNLLIGHCPNVAINAQVTIFGEDNYGAPPSSENLERALARLKQATVLGTVEEYDKTMVVAEYFLQPLFSEIQLHYSRYENASNHTLLPGYNGSLESIKEILGASYFSDLCDLNDLDIELWHAASKELRRRAGYIKDFSLRFESFLKRCMEANSALEKEDKQHAALASSASIPKSLSKVQGSELKETMKKNHEAISPVS